jgi:hypothetical protein
MACDSKTWIEDDKKRKSDESHDHKCKTLKKILANQIQYSVK